jgi:cobalamin biosynthesis Mg chelatase CobN
MSTLAQKKDPAAQADLEDRLSKAGAWVVDSDSKQIVNFNAENVFYNSPNAQVAQAKGHSAAVAGNASQAAASKSEVSKGTDSGAGAGKWVVVVVVLLVACGVFGALYLFGTIKLNEAVFGVTLVGVLAAILALLKK